jgi:hypothetical protein
LIDEEAQGEITFKHIAIKSFGLGWAYIVMGYA